MATDWRLPWAGRCRCGRVTLAVTKPPLLSMACHCTGCQTMSASAFSLSLALPLDGLTVTHGEVVLGGLKDPKAQHFFCGHCKSWLFTKPVGVAPIVNLRPSTLDARGWFVPFIETYTSEKLSWASTPAKHSFRTLPAMEEYGPLVEAFATSGIAPRGPAPAPPPRPKPPVPSSKPKRLSECSRCGELGGQLVNTGRDEQFDEAFYALERLEGGFRRCPECRTFFEWVDRPQLHGSGNLDEQESTRLSPKESALLEMLFPADPAHPPDPGPVAAFFEGLPLERLLAALRANDYRGPEVVRPFVPELAKRLSATGDREMLGALRAWAYENQDRSHTLFMLLESLPPTVEGAAAYRELHAYCDAHAWSSDMP